MKSITVRQWKAATFVSFLLAVSFFVNSAEAVVTLSWNPPTTNVDGTSCTDLAGYKIYYDTDGTGTPYEGGGLNEGESPITISINELSDPDHPDTVLSGLTEDINYNLVVTAFDTSGNESLFSNEIVVIEKAVDTDNDGLSDTVEAAYGLDPAVSDSDGDGLSDPLEFGSYKFPLDSDGDGIIDALDTDSDNDGSMDSVEKTMDNDNDGAPNYRDRNDIDGPNGDQDEDGISNIDETTYGINPNLADSDQDEIPDSEEWGSSNLPVDTDMDGRVDAIDEDSDEDGVFDVDEAGEDVDQDGILDRLNNKIGTMSTSLGKMSVLLNHPTGTLVQTTFTEDVNSNSEQPNVDFPYGGVEYQIEGLAVGETILVTLIMSDQLPDNAEYWKYDNVYGFEKLDSQVNGKEISFNLTDGGKGDCDQIANGIILDPGFVGIPVETSSNAYVTASAPSSGGGGCSLSGEEGEMCDIILLLAPLVFCLVFRMKRSYL